VALELTSVHGVGYNKALELQSMGIRTVEQLRQAVVKKPSLINAKQKIGLKYYDDFLQKIPREKITKMFEIVKE
jgi:nucleotidyltransferase/DNA polymerase involved in DNA repair